MANKIKLRINASSLPWMRCSRLWWLKVIQGYKPAIERPSVVDSEGILQPATKTPVNSASPVYGQALHAYIHMMCQTKGDMGLSQQEMFRKFHVPKLEDRKSPYLSDDRHLLLTSMMTWSYVSKDTTCDLLILPDGKPATEVTFSILYYEDEEIEVWLEGTLDALVKIRGGCHCVRDFKSTRQDPKSDYLSDYELSQQLRFYTLALKLMGEKYPETPLGKLGNSQLGAFIDGIFLDPEASNTKIVRSHVFIFSKEDLDEFRRMLDKKILELKKVVQTFSMDSLPHREGMFHNNCRFYGYKCEFWNVCKTNHNGVTRNLLNKYFVQRDYNPLHHNDE